MRLRDHGAWPTLSHISHFLSRIFISHLAFFISHLAFLSCISHFYLASRIFYLASRIFVSHLAFFISHLAFLSHISHFYLASRIFYLAFTSRNFFLFFIKSHLECPLQASVGIAPSETTSTSLGTRLRRAARKRCATNHVPIPCVS